MGIFKEEISVLEDLESRQQPIYKDAVDTGVLAYERFHPYKGTVKEVMHELITDLVEVGACKLVWKSNSPIVQRQYKITVRWSSEGDGAEAGVLYVNDTGRNREYFSIQVSGIHGRENREDY